MKPLPVQPGRVRGYWSQMVPDTQEFTSPRSIITYCSAEPAAETFRISNGTFSLSASQPTATMEPRSAGVGALVPTVSSGSVDPNAESMQSYGSVPRMTHSPSLPEVTPIIVTSRMSNWAWGVNMSNMPAVASIASVRPSGFEFQTKFRSTTTGVKFLTTMRGLPGMNCGQARDM